MEINELNDSNFDLNNFWHHQHGIYISYYIIQTMGLKAAVFLGELLNEYNHWRNNRRLEKDGSFYCTRDTMQNKIGIKDDTQRKIIDQLKKRGLIDTYCGGVPYKRYIKLNIPNIVSLFDYDKNFGEKITDAIEDEEYDFSEESSNFINYREYEKEKNLPDTSGFYGDPLRKSPNQPPVFTETPSVKVQRSYNIYIEKNNNKKINNKYKDAKASYGSPKNGNIYFNTLKDPSKEIQKEQINETAPVNVTKNDITRKNKELQRKKPAVSIQSLVTEKMSDINNNIARQTKKLKEEEEKQKRENTRETIKSKAIKKDIEIAKQYIQSEKVLELLNTYLLSFSGTHNFLPDTISWERKIKELLSFAKNEEQQLASIDAAILNSWKSFYEVKDKYYKDDSKIKNNNTDFYNEEGVSEDSLEEASGELF